MDYRQYLMIIKLLILLFLNIVPQNVSCNNLWHIVSNDSIVWENINVSHKDHLEMSGLMISSIVHYGIDETGRWMVDRELIWPSLRVIPNDTYGSLKYRFRSECLSYLLVDKSNLSNEKVISISLSGVISVESLFKENGVKLKRILFPSVDEAAFCEYYEIVNISDKNIEVEMPNLNVLYKTDSIKGVYGSYNVKYYTTIADNIVTLFPNDIISFGAVYQAFKENDSLESINVYNEYIKRKSFLKEIENNLTLETPDNVINTMFNFAKIRASESIYKTKGGFLHGPGGGVYYAAVWANDQAEYVNPFFPFLGYDIGNKSAMDSFRLYMRYMNDDYKPLPSSIIAEGDDIWNGAGDRGDAAMIAYGAARYALASGNKDEANELWPLIKWRLEHKNEVSKNES